MFVIANEDDDISKLKSIDFNEIYEHIREGVIIYDIDSIM